MMTSGASKTDRQKMRRDQILDAASECFLENGFHGASMAQVAAATQMSVGQIYRFFASKEEIISAIIERQLALVAARFPQPGVSPGEMREALSTEAKLTAADFFDSRRAGLIIEIRAEAARNPAVAAIVRSADETVSKQVRALIVAGSSRVHGSAELDRRTNFLATIIDGLIFRSPINPTMDQAFVDELIDLVCNAAIFRDT